MAACESTSGCKISDNAIRAGYEKGGKPLFIARAEMGGLWTSGKCGSHLPGAHIPYECKEFIVKDCDVLVYPINAFISRGKMGGLWTSGKCGSHLAGAYIPYDCKEFIIKDYEVFVYPINAVGFLDWQQAFGGKVPDKALKQTHTFTWDGPITPGVWFRVRLPLATPTCVLTARNDTTLKNTKSSVKSSSCERQKRKCLDKRTISVNHKNMNLSKK